MQMQNLEVHRKAQNIAKKAMKHLKDYIKEGMSEAEIAEEARSFMAERSASFWYYGKAAIVLVGNRTTLSIPGKDYTPSGKKVSSTDLVTVDLSPEIDGCWGDHARSFVVANGMATDRVSPESSGLRKKLLDGIEVGKNLHEWLRQKVRSTPSIKFGELYLGAKKYAGLLGYGILDFKGNVGHTIERELEQRVYIEEGSGMRLSEIGLFAFEPHIGKGGYGFKREDIYYFSEGKLWKL